MPLPVLDAAEVWIPAQVQRGSRNDDTPSVVTVELDESGDLRTLRASLSARNDGSSALVLSGKADRMTGKGINDVGKRLTERAGVEPYAYGAWRAQRRKRPHAPALGRVADASSRRGKQSLRRTESATARDDSHDRTEVRPL